MLFHRQLDPIVRKSFHLFIIMGEGYFRIIALHSARDHSKDYINVRHRRFSIRPADGYVVEHLIIYLISLRLPDF